MFLFSPEPDSFLTLSARPLGWNGLAGWNHPAAAGPQAGRHENENERNKNPFPSLLPPLWPTHHSPDGHDDLARAAPLRHAAGRATRAVANPERIVINGLRYFEMPLA